jgi:hypothetical protein
MDKFRVYRAPGNSDGRIERQDNNEGSISPGYHKPLVDNFDGGMTVQFLAGSDSKRISKFWVWFGPERFQAVANAMIAGSPKAARQAFLMAMLKDTNKIA